MYDGTVVQASPELLQSFNAWAAMKLCDAGQTFSRDVSSFSDVSLYSNCGVNSLVREFLGTHEGAMSTMSVGSGSRYPYSDVTSLSKISHDPSMGNGVYSSSLEVEWGYEGDTPHEIFEQGSIDGLRNFAQMSHSDISSSYPWDRDMTAYAPIREPHEASAFDNMESFVDGKYQSPSFDNDVARERVDMSLLDTQTGMDYNLQFA